MRRQNMHQFRSIQMSIGAKKTDVDLVKFAAKWNGGTNLDNKCVNLQKIMDTNPDVDFKICNRLTEINSDQLDWDQA